MGHLLDKSSKIVHKSDDVCPRNVISATFNEITENLILMIMMCNTQLKSGSLTIMFYMHIHGRQVPVVTKCFDLETFVIHVAILGQILHFFSHSIDENYVFPQSSDETRTIFFPILWQKLRAF